MHTKKISEHHGLSKTRLYKIWCNMRSRCNRLKDNSYKRYGGRGIIVCPEWNESFLAFHEFAINNGYANNLTIERINNDGNYEPNNVTFIPLIQQALNRRSNTNITIGDVTSTVTAWAKISGIEKQCIYSRIKLGHTSESLLNKSRPRNNNITINGTTKKYMEWVKYSGLNGRTIRRRMKNGLTELDLIAPPHPGIKHNNFYRDRTND